MFTRDREQGTVLPLSVPGTPWRKNRAQAPSVQVPSTFFFFFIKMQLLLFLVIFLVKVPVIILEKLEC